MGQYIKRYRTCKEKQKFMERKQGTGKFPLPPLAYDFFHKFCQVTGFVRMIGLARGALIIILLYYYYIIILLLYYYIIIILLYYYYIIIFKKHLVKFSNCGKPVTPKY